MRDDRSPLWRSKFIEHFDLVPNLFNSTLKSIYQKRRKILRRNVRFRKGDTRLEIQSLYVLRDLMLESFAAGCVSRDKEGNLTSRNLLAIEKFALGTDLLQNVLRPDRVKDQNPFLMVIQIMLSHLRFLPEMDGIALGFVDAQRAMYTSRQKECIFGGKNMSEINMWWVANAFEFFKHHLGSHENPEIQREYRLLEGHDTIKAWRKPLINGAPHLGKHWKGAYAYLEHNEVSVLRQLPADEDGIFIDLFNRAADGSYPFQGLRLNFLCEDPGKRWPKLFERHLQSLSHPCVTSPTQEVRPSQHSIQGKRTTRAQSRSEPALVTGPAVQHQKTIATPMSIGFEGSGDDYEEKFYAAGWLNPLPSQHGIPGWMRFTMMKFFVNGEDWPDENETAEPFSMKRLSGDPYLFMDTDALWAYEGVMLPGGEVVVGRWWSPRREDGRDDEDENDDDVYSGPFIFWCVDEKV